MFYIMFPVFFLIPLLYMVGGSFQMVDMFEVYF